jgi:hypothetical protein
MANIQVEGIGGLGMVAAVVAVAVSDPRIRLATIMAAVLGAELALALIGMRRRTGALSSGGDGADDPSNLRIDGEPRRTPPARVPGNIDKGVRSLAELCAARQVARNPSPLTPRVNPTAAIDRGCPARQ